MNVPNCTNNDHWTVYYLGKHTQSLRLNNNVRLRTIQNWANSEVAYRCWLLGKPFFNKVSVASSVLLYFPALTELNSECIPESSENIGKKWFNRSGKKHSGRRTIKYLPGLENWFPEYCNRLSGSTDFDNLSISIKFDDRLLAIYIYIFF